MTMATVETSSAGTMEDLFGEVISRYSRATAIEDGVLVDVTGPLTVQAGFRFPIAMTRAAYETCVALTPAAKRAGNDVNGRLWDVLWIAKMAIRNSRNGGEQINFAVLCCTKSVRPSRVALKAICGPGDDAEPVITIMLRDED